MLVSACLMIKDENEYLEEWLKYHHGIGIDEFYIYDNNSKESVYDFIKRNENLKDLNIRVIDWDKEGMGKHVACFNHRIHEYKSIKSKVNDDINEWCCFIDIDEFIVPTQFSDIKELISEYENDHVAIKIGRYNFGDNGYIERPDGGVIENFTNRCDDEGREVLKVGGKSIVRLDRTKKAKDPHNFEVIGDTINLDINKAQINHYWTKSEQEWKEHKIKKGGGNGLKRDMDKYRTNQKWANKVEDKKIFEFINYD